MTIVFADHRFEHHRTGYHPETSARVAQSLFRLESRAWYQDLKKGRFALASDDRLLRTHRPEVLRGLQETCESGGGHLDADTFVSPESLEVSKLAAGAALAACEQVLSGAERNAFCLLRPPGHHASREASRGFCVFNNVAIAAQYALDVHGLTKVLIVDFDVHHGDGTQEIFYQDPAVHYLSVHRFPFYPGTGHESETGAGPGLGSTHNVPIRYGTPGATYLQKFRAGLERAVSQARPEMIFISAGFDAHKEDPIGSLGLEAADFVVMTKWIKQAADLYANGRIVSCLEGGYNLATLPGLIEDHILCLNSD